MLDPDSLRARVAELAALDAKRRIFGANAHRYRFAAPFPADQLAAFEARVGCALPDDYRAFITRVGNGGAGPSYGVIGFQADDGEDYTEYDDLGRPFAYTGKHNPVHLLDGEDDPDDEGDDEAAEDAAEERLRAYWRAFDSRGALYLCHHGCASRSLLVVSGPCRGEIWDDETANDAGYAPAMAASGQRHTFATWYAEWLDRAFAELRG